MLLVEMPTGLTVVTVIAILAGVYLGLAHFTPLRKALWSPFRKKS